MKKRGLYIALYLMVGAAIGLIIVVALSQLVSKVGGDSTLEREYLSKDLSLLLNTIVAAPGDVDYYYAVPERFHISAKNQLITIKDSTRNAESTYYFASSEGLNEIKFESESSPKALRIIKKEGQITIKGIYDENERSTISSFKEFIEFGKRNSERNYNFRCREEFPLQIGNNYYVIVSKNGNAVLYYDAGEVSQEITSEKLPELKHLESGIKEDFYISEKIQYTATKNWYTSQIIMVNDEKSKTWSWAKQSIQTKELPECEAQELTKNPK